MPTCSSTWNILLFAPGSYSFDVTSFSTANTTPSFPRRPITVPEFSTALAAYSTWNTRPSGENCEAERSYCNYIENKIISMLMKVLACFIFKCELEEHKHRKIIISLRTPGTNYTKKV